MEKEGCDNRILKISWNYLEIYCVYVITKKLIIFVASNDTNWYKPEYKITSANNQF